MKNAILKSVITVIIGLILWAPASAQLTSKELKMFNKSIKQHDAGKYDKAISTIGKIQAEHPFNEVLWKYRIIYEQDRYTSYRRAAVQKAVAKGQSTLNDPKVTSNLISMLYQCQLATRWADHQVKASGILRQYLVDEDVDKDIPEKAEKLYDEGDEYFNEQKWNSSISKYKEALEIEPKYYMAAFSIGAAYLQNEDYTNAIVYFKKAGEIAPGRAYPIQCIADCYIKLKDYEKAKEACIDGILRYPDVAFFEQLTEISEKLGKTFDRHWGMRLVSGNSIGTSQDPVTNEVWAAYRSAKDRVSDYCNDDGVITKKNSVTEEKYLEVYSWQQMLKKSDDETDKIWDNFPYAKQMQEKGFLDCYAFISCYHSDLQDQYKDFSKNNAERIRTYINTYLLK
jgi:tetratricopeptide (TPR) repeat protein